VLRLFNHPKTSASRIKLEKILPFSVNTEGMRQSIMFILIIFPQIRQTNQMTSLVKQLWLKKQHQQGRMELMTRSGFQI
jgi:hypothetical protein